METKEILQKICAAPGVSGAEHTTATVIKELVSEFTDDITTDALGNLIAVVNPQGEKGMMLFAHMDKIGLVVTGIDRESGFLRIFPAGGVDARTASAQRVRVYGTETREGVIISTPPHLSNEKKAVPVDELTVDCGLPYETISKIVFPGCRAELRNGFYELKNGICCSEFIDNAAGCAVILKALEYLKGKAENTRLECVFSTREEVGKGGALTAAFRSRAEDALVFDVSFASAPGVPAERCAPLGSGAMIGCSPILQKDAFDLCVQTAKEENLPFTVEISGRSTGTDADVAVTAGAGKRTALISVPLKNMHTPVETVDIRDIEVCARLAAAYVERRNGQ